MILIALSVISYDIWFYISHVILHNRNVYKYHKEHHTKPVPKFLDTYVGHPFETVFQGVGMFIPFMMYQYDLYTLLWILAILNTRGMMRHDGRCAFLIGNHHLLHHKYPNYNFGEYWIDSLCGTKYINDKEYIRGIFYI